LSGVNSYTGGTTVSAGVLQGTTDSLQGDITNSATVTFNQSTDGTYSGAISGSGDLTKEGTGNTTLSGINTFTGSTTVNGGTLSVNGSTTSATIVNASGTLAGTGTISNSVTNNGTVSAGVGGSGTLTVSSFTNNSSGTVQVDVTPGGTGGVLAVTGAANITAGGTVNVNATSGNYNAGQKFTFLTASGGVSGQFDSITDNITGLTPILGENGTSVFFTLLRNGTTYAAIARTQNQLAVGTYLDRVSPTATGDLSTVLNGINVISDDEARAAFDQLGGPIHPTLAQIGVQNTSMVIYQVAKRLRSGPFTPGGGISVADDDRSGRGAPIALVDCNSDGEPCYQGCPDEGASHASGWVLGYGQGGAARPDGNAPGVSFGMGGTVAGFEHWADDCHLFGFYGGYVGTDVRTAILSHDSGINGGQFGGYFFMDDGFSYYTALGGFEFDGYTTNRLLNFDDIDRSPTSNYGGWQSFAYLERGFSFQSCMSVFQPFVAIQYIYLRQNAFTETGADSVDLAGSGATANSLRSMLGARWQYAMMNRNGLRTLPELHAMWMHEYLDSNTSVSEQFSPTPTGSSTFSIQGLDFGRDWAVLGVNLTWEMHDCWSMYVNYDIESNARETVHVGTGGLAHMW
jgi:autotransporter-associated beta strand protein